MFHDKTPARVAGPLGYTQRDLAALTPGERAKMRRELDALDNKLQWGFEPDRWAKGAAWHDDDLIAEAGDFREVLGEADKVWKTQVGLNSPFLPALAAKPRAEREQMRERGKAIRDLVAFGETPERWARGIGTMRDGLRDPDSDTGRLLALHGQRNDLLPHLDAMDHALDYLDEVEKQGGADSAHTPSAGIDYRTIASLSKTGDKTMSYGNRTWQAPGEAPSDAAREGGDEGRDGGESRSPPRDAGPEAPGDWDAIMDAFAAMDEDKRAIALRQMDAIARMARSVLEAAPEERPGVYDAALRQARSMGIPVDNLPPDYDSSVEALLEQHIGVARAFLDRAGGPRKQE